VIAPARRGRRSRPDDPSGARAVEPPPPRARIAAWILTVVGLPLLTALLAAAGRTRITLATDLLLFLVATVGIAVLGRVLVGASPRCRRVLLANWFFVEPTHTLTVSDPGERRGHRDLRGRRDRRQRPRRSDPAPAARRRSRPRAEARCPGPHERDPDRRPRSASLSC
jgi:hypothetical protein